MKMVWNNTEEFKVYMDEEDLKLYSNAAQKWMWKQMDKIHIPVHEARIIADLRAEDDCFLSESVYRAESMDLFRELRDMVEYERI